MFVVLMAVGTGKAQHSATRILSATRAASDGAIAAVDAAGPREDGSIGGLKAKFVNVNGIRTRYYEAGKGEPMILIHAEQG
ncbi:MAG: hypothetical protein ACRD4Y_10270, partial [Candidatus Acidiferrales bacterium]